jgi:methyltransferase (TIGR00027 family)
MSESPIQNVSDTAFMVATYRAMETERPDSLFRDPLAAKLVGKHGTDIVASLPPAFVAGWTVVIRTVIIDDFIRTAIAKGVDTVVNLGAGLDTRPYRMTLPEPLRWIEVDYPRIIELKEERLSGESPHCRLERVKMDLTDRPARKRLLSDVSSRSSAVLVLTEGVVPYLTNEDVGALADDLRAEEAIRSWVVDYFSPDALRFRKRSGMTRHLQNAPFRFEPKDWFGFFSEHGWAVQNIRYISDEAERLHRPMPMPRTWRALMKLRMVFATSRRRKALRRFAGYAILEPRASGRGQSDHT